MFDPSKFSTTPARTVLGNSGHAIAAHCELTMKKVPKKSWDVEYVVGNNGKWVATYMAEYNTLSVHEVTLEEFKALVVADATLPGEPIDVPETDKWVGNALMRELTIMKLI